MTGPSFMICNPQLLSEDSKSQTESLLSRVKSVKKKTGEAERKLQGSSEQRAESPGAGTGEGCWREEGR